MAKVVNDKKAKTVKVVYLAFTPCSFTHEGTEYFLYNNETYELPDIDFVRSLIGQGRMVEKNTDHA